MNIVYNKNVASFYIFTLSAIQRVFCFSVVLINLLVIIFIKLFLFPLSFFPSGIKLITSASCTVHLWSCISKDYSEILYWQLIILFSKNCEPEILIENTALLLGRISLCKKDYERISDEISKTPRVFPEGIIKKSLEFILKNLQTTLDSAFITLSEKQGIDKSKAFSLVQQAVDQHIEDHEAQENSLS